MRIIKFWYGRLKRYKTVRDGIYIRPILILTREEIESIVITN